MCLKKYKNIHEGERVFIVGNGPSLANTPLEMLNDEFTFACNKINLIYPQTSWRPSYYVYMRPGPPKDEYQHIMETIEQNIPVFMCSSNIPYFPNKDNILEIQQKKINNVPTDGSEPLNDYFDSFCEMVNSSWSEDISECVYNYGPTIYRSAQIANYMGFDEMIFVGCDGYKDEKKGPLIFPEANNPHEYMRGGYSRFFKFIIENGHPIKSFVNGLSFKIHYSMFNPLTNYVFEDEHHFDPSYKVRYKSPNMIKRKNERNINMHNAIEFAGEECDFTTYNASLEKNIDIHTPINLKEII